MCIKLTAGGMVSKAIHTACYETRTLIGFINYDRLLATGGLTKFNYEKNGSINDDVCSDGGNDA